MPDLSTNNSSSSSPSSFVFKSSRYKVVSPLSESQSRKPELSFAQLEAHRRHASAIKTENSNGFSVRLPPVPPTAPQADAPARIEHLSKPRLRPPSDSISTPPTQLPSKSSNVAPRRMSTSHFGLSDVFMTSSFIPISPQDTFPAQIPFPSQRPPEGLAHHYPSESISQKSKKIVIGESIHKRSHSHEHVVQDTQSTLFSVNKKLEAHALTQSGAPDDKVLAKAPLSTSSIHHPKGVGPA